MWRASGCHLRCHVELLDVKNRNKVNGIPISQGSFQENSDVFIHSINIHWAPCLSGLLSNMWQNPTSKWHFWNKTISLQNWWSRDWRLRLSWVQEPKYFIRTWSLHPMLASCSGRPFPNHKRSCRLSNYVTFHHIISYSHRKTGCLFPSGTRKSQVRLGGELSLDLQYQVFTSEPINVTRKNENSEWPGLVTCSPWSLREVSPTSQGLEEERRVVPKGKTRLWL